MHDPTPHLPARTQLRRAAPGDAALVRDLTRAAYARWVGVIGREPKPMTADHDAAVRDHLVDLLHQDGVLVGLIEMRSEPDHLLIGPAQPSVSNNPSSSLARGTSEET